MVSSHLLFLKSGAEATSLPFVPLSLRCRLLAARELEMTDNSLFSVKSFRCNSCLTFTICGTVHVRHAPGSSGVPERFRSFKHLFPGIGNMYANILPLQNSPPRSTVNSATHTKVTSPTQDSIPHEPLPVSFGHLNARTNMAISTTPMLGQTWDKVRLR